ncbi:hypothetical protein QL285_088335 [Trifolium repens]|nr:hypothetical protein QL285_088335 [Trifolium repens]
MWTKGSRPKGIRSQAQNVNAPCKDTKWKNVGSKIKSGPPPQDRTRDGGSVSDQCLCGEVARGDLQLPHAGWEVTVTLDDVSCLLHLSNEGRLPDHEYVNKKEGTKLMVDLIGADPAAIENEMVKTKWSHLRHTYLQSHFQTLRAHIDDYEAEGNHDEVLRHQNFALRTYLLLLVGYTIFADTSKNCVHI